MNKQNDFEKEVEKEVEVISFKSVPQNKALESGGMQED